MDDEEKSYTDPNTGEQFSSYREYLESLPYEELESMAKYQKYLNWYFFES